MMPSLRPVVLLTLACALLGAAAGPAAAQSPAPLTEKALYQSGPNGRFLMDGEWLFRLDPGNVGLTQGFAKQTTRAGWTPTSVPNAWNATDQSVESFMGSVGWYRKDFKLPSAKAALAWVMRFESVNYRSRVYLNGRLVGSNKGAYLPFEVRMPPSLLKRAGTNRLVVRVENKRLATDFPPAGLSVSGTPTGGWWNYGGILREVYLRRVDARRLLHGAGPPGPAVRELRRDGQRAADGPQLRDDRHPGEAHGHASARASSTSGPSRSGRRSSRRSPAPSASPTRSSGRRTARTSTGSTCARRRRAGASSSATSSERASAPSRSSTASGC